MTIKGNYINDIFISKKIKISNKNKAECSYVKIKDLVDLMKIVKDDSSSIIKYESLSENKHSLILSNTGDHRKIFGNCECVYTLNDLSSFEFDLIQDLINNK